MFNKFMEIHTVVKGVAIYLWPFVLVAVVSISSWALDTYIL